MTELVTVGRVGRPHGINGAFVVENASDAPERFTVGAVLLVGGRTATVVESKRSGGRRVIRVEGEAPRGAALEVESAALPPPERDEYYVFQLVGLDVERADGRPLGRVVEVEPGVANDVLRLDDGLLLPLVGACVRQVDLEQGRIVVEAGFDEAD
jgi:16S rRNA processing protein RimM